MTFYADVQLRPSEAPRLLRGQPEARDGPAAGEPDARALLSHCFAIDCHRAPLSPFRTLTFRTWLSSRRSNELDH
jgi:hypothetical protein